MDFYAVNACVLEHFGAFRKCVHKFLDFSLCHLSRRNFIRPAVGRRACGSGYFVKVHKRLAENPQSFVRIELFHHFANGKGPAEACRKLNKELCARFMKFGHPFFQVVVHLFVLVEPLTEHRVVYRLTSGHYKTCVVLCDFHNEACAVLIEMVVFHPAEKVGAAHTCEHNPVLDFTVTYFPRGKQWFKSFFHKNHHSLSGNK